MLRRRDSGESDRRLTLLTQEEGVIDVVAKGARKGGSRLAGSSEPLVACILHLASGKKNRFITQTQPISSFPGLRADYERLSLGLALAELASAVLPHEEPAQEAFSFMVRALRYLETHEKPLVVFVWASLQLLSLSGFLPQFDRCVVSGDRIDDSAPYVSPIAGGFTRGLAAEKYTDRFRVRAEVLLGLSACAELETPPRNLKFVEECVLALFPFWINVAERALPANETVVGELRAEMARDR